MKRLMLIDGNGILFRSYYGSAYSKAGILINKDGIAVNAIITMNRIINNLISDYEPSHVLIAWDTPKKTVRHKRMESYKAGRTPAPVELKQQFPLAKEMLDFMGFKQYELEGYEADDIIGSVAKNLGNFEHVFVVTSDKDLYQLVDENISIISPQNGMNPDKLVSLENFRTHIDCTPEQIIDYKGIVGDPSDNLPGVKGVGKKGAGKLLAEYKTLENIYDNLENFSPNLAGKFIASKDIAFLCKSIATLILDIEIPYNEGELLFENEVTDELIDFYKRLHLHSLVKKYEKRLVSKKDTLDFVF